VIFGVGCQKLETIARENTENKGSYNEIYNKSNRSRTWRDIEGL
jgi:hypothetical protein